MKVILFTTSNAMSGRSHELVRMIDSVASNESAANNIQHFLLIQRDEVNQCHDIKRHISYPATVLSHNELISLSSARNILLKEALPNLSPDLIVGFPDDDCWFPDQFFSSLIRFFEEDKELGLVICRIASKPINTWEGAAMRSASSSDVLRRSCSCGIFIRGDVAAKVGDFDTSLGLGSENPSGEDTDYALRAWALSRKALITDQALVGHRDISLESIARHFPSDMLVASRYRGVNSRLFYEYIRKAAVGAYFVACGRLSFRDYLHALRNSKFFTWYAIS